MISALDGLAVGFECALYGFEACCGDDEVGAEERTGDFAVVKAVAEKFRSWFSGERYSDGAAETA